MNGKGDTPRPVNRAKYDAGYERAFGTEEQVRARRQLHIAQQKIAKAHVEMDFIVPTVSHLEVLMANLRVALNEPREPHDGDLSNPETVERIRKAMKIVPPRVIYPEKIVPDGRIISVDSVPGGSDDKGV